MPITAGGTVFMYNLKINGQQVTNLRLSGSNIAKIFTGAITNWDDPALAADNPALKLPNQAIVPVVRSDGSGSSYELTEWMISQYPAIWNAYCAKAGRAPSCGATSFYPTVTGMIAQSGDLGVAGYVAQSYATGSIGYVNYSYALDAKFPVAQMLNAAGYYTEPTRAERGRLAPPGSGGHHRRQQPRPLPDPESAGRLHRHRPPDLPAVLLRLPGPSHHGAGPVHHGQGPDLGGLRLLRPVPGPVESAPLGYSPMPINLVQAGFDQIAKIPGVAVQAINIQHVQQPDILDIRRQPTGGHRPSASRVRQAGADPVHHRHRWCGRRGYASQPGLCRSHQRGNESHGYQRRQWCGQRVGWVGGRRRRRGRPPGPRRLPGTSTATAPCDPSSGSCSSAEGLSGAAPAAATATLPVSTGWSWNQSLLVLIGLALVGLMLLPGVLVRRMDRPKQ